MRLGAFGVLLLAACSSALTQSNSGSQSEPRVVVVPPDELSGNPAVPSSSVRSEPAAAAIPEKGDSGQQYASASAGSGQVSIARKHSYNSCNVPGKQIALTFDDGPHPELTPKLLDYLKERGIKATFFVIGKNAAAHPEIIKRMVDEGHEVGNHSWSHPALNKLSAAGVSSELDKTSEAVASACGAKPHVMRPPYGATNAALNRKFDEEFGMKAILWDVDPLDWKYRNSARVTSQILENAKPGSIILSHDIHATTVAAMPATLDGLLQKGFTFVTVSELISLDRPVEVASAKPAPSANP